MHRIRRGSGCSASPSLSWCGLRCYDHAVSLICALHEAAPSWIQKAWRAARLQSAGRQSQAMVKAWQTRQTFAGHSGQPAPHTAELHAIASSCRVTAETANPLPAVP